MVIQPGILADLCQPVLNGGDQFIQGGIQTSLAQGETLRRHVFAEHVVVQFPLMLVVALPALQL